MFITAGLIICCCCIKERIIVRIVKSKKTWRGINDGKRIKAPYFTYQKKAIASNRKRCE